jgi:outer membrane protein
MAKRYGRCAGILFLLAGTALPVFSQTKLGIVNSQEVLEKSTEGKRIVARLQESDRQNQTTMARLDEEIRGLQSKLSTQSLTLSQEASLQLSSDLEKKTTERKRKAEDAYAAFTALRDRLFAKLQEELLNIVAQIGKEKGFDLILDLGKSGAAYWSPAIDLTAEVIKRYDASKAAVK